MDFSSATAWRLSLVFFRNFSFPGRLSLTAHFFFFCVFPPQPRTAIFFLGKIIFFLGPRSLPGTFGKTTPLPLLFLRPLPVIQGRALFAAGGLTLPFLADSMLPFHEEQFSPFPFCQVVAHFFSSLPCVLPHRFGSRKAVEQRVLAQETPFWISSPPLPLHGGFSFPSYGTCRTLFFFSISPFFCPLSPSTPPMARCLSSPGDFHRRLFSSRACGPSEWNPFFGSPVGIRFHSFLPGNLFFPRQNRVLLRLLSCTIFFFFPCMAVSSLPLESSFFFCWEVAPFSFPPSFFLFWSRTFL